MWLAMGTASFISESTKPTGPDTGLDDATSAAGDISALFCGALVAFSTADSSTRFL
jgi:hypothetical protein